MQTASFHDIFQQLFRVVPAVILSEKDSSKLSLFLSTNQSLSFDERRPIIARILTEIYPIPLIVELKPGIF